MAFEIFLLLAIVVCVLALISVVRAVYFYSTFILRYLSNKIMPWALWFVYLFLSYNSPLHSLVQTFERSVRTLWRLHWEASTINITCSFGEVLVLSNNRASRSLHTPFAAWRKNIPFPEELAAPFGMLLSVWMFYFSLLIFSFFPFLSFLSFSFTI